MNGNSNTGQGINTSTAVLQGGLQPFQLQLDMNAQRQAEQARKEKIKAAQKAARDKTIGNLMEWSPDTAYEPYDEQVRNFGQTHVREWVVDQINQFGDQVVNDPEFLSKLKKRHDFVNTYAAKSNQIKSLHTSKLQLYEADENIDTGRATTALNNALFNDDMSGKELTKLDLGAAEGIEGNPEYFDKGKIAKRIVEGLPEMINKFYTKKNNEYGEQYYEISQIKRNMLSRELGPTGMPKPIITDEFVTLVRQDPYVQKILDADDRDDKEVLKEMFGSYAQFEESVTPGRAITDPDKGTASGRERQQYADRRFEGYKRAIEGDATELRRLENAKTSQGRIVSVTPEGATDEHGFKSVKITFEREAEGRGDRTETVTESYNLDDPFGQDQFASVFNEALNSKSSIEKKVPWEDFRPFNDEYRDQNKKFSTLDGQQYTVSQLKSEFGYTDEQIEQARKLGNLR